MFRVRIEGEVRRVPGGAGARRTSRDPRHGREAENDETIRFERQ